MERIALAMQGEREPVPHPPAIIGADRGATQATGGSDAGLEGRRARVAPRYSGGDSMERARTRRVLPVATSAARGDLEPRALVDDAEAEVARRGRPDVGGAAVRAGRRGRAERGLHVAAV